MKSILILCVLMDSVESFAAVYICLCCIVIGSTIYGIRSETLRPMNPHTVNFIRTGFYVVGILGAILVLAEPKYADFQMTILSALVLTTVLSILIADRTSVADGSFSNQAELQNKKRDPS